MSAGRSARIAFALATALAGRGSAWGKSCRVGCLRGVAFPLKPRHSCAMLAFILGNRGSYGLRAALFFGRNSSAAPYGAGILPAVPARGALTCGQDARTTTQRGSLSRAAELLRS